MATQIDRVLDGVWVGLHTCTLGTFLAYLEPLGSKYANLQQKITFDTSCGKSQTFHCSNVTTMESFRLSTARVRCDFLLQIDILRAKGYNKNVPKVQVCNPTYTPS